MYFPRLRAARLIGPDWRIVFVGSEASKAEIMRLFFPDGSEEEDLGFVYRWQVSDRCPRWLEGGVDLVVYEQFGRVGTLRFGTPIALSVPSWVDQVLPLPESPDEILTGNHLRRRQLNKCKKNGYSLTSSRELARFARFYHDIYLPFIEQRHRDHAQPTPYNELKRSFRRGELLLVELDGKTVAGKVCYVNGSTGYNNDWGIAVSDPRFMKDGVGSLLDWGSIMRARRHGAELVNMGGSRGWSSDGVFRYKSLWGARTEERSKIHTNWWILARDVRPALRDHMNKIGFVSCQDGNFFEVRIAGDSSAASDEALKKQLSAVGRKGLAGVLEVSASAGLRAHFETTRRESAAL
jgi:hypothetical protein